MLVDLQGGLIGGWLPGREQGRYTGTGLFFWLCGVHWQITRFTKARLVALT